MKLYMPLIALMTGCLHTSESFSFRQTPQEINRIVDYVISKPLPSVSSVFCRDFPEELRICYVPKGQPRDYSDDTLIVRVDNITLFDDGLNGHLDSILIDLEDGTTITAKSHRRFQQAYSSLLSQF